MGAKLRERGASSVAASGARPWEMHVGVLLVPVSLFYASIHLGWSDVEGVAAAGCRWGRWTPRGGGELNLTRVEADTRNGHFSCFRRMDLSPLQTMPGPVCTWSPTPTRSIDG